MKTIKLHRTQSQSWRLLVDGNVHPLFVGFQTLSQAVVKLVNLYDQLGPFSYESLKQLQKDLKECLSKAWAHTDTVDNNVSDCGSAGAFLVALMVKHYPIECNEDAKNNSRSFAIPSNSSFSEVMKQTSEERREIKGVHLKGEVTSGQLMASKHNPQDDDLIEQIRYINPVSPNLRLTGPHVDKIRWGLVIDDKEGKETWLVGCSYDEEKAKEILARLLALLNKPLEGQ